MSDFVFHCSKYGCSVIAPLPLQCIIKANSNYWQISVRSLCRTVTGSSCDVCTAVKVQLRWKPYCEQWETT